MLYLYMAVIACIIALLAIFALAIDEAIRGGDGAEAMSLFESGMQASVPAINRRISVACLT